MMLKELLQSNYSTEQIAQSLLGKLLVHEKDGIRRSGFIVETEAYLGVSDKAAHSYGGLRTKRTEIMFQEAGSIYTHVMHTHVLLNIITQPIGTPEGILIRAIEPYEGIPEMERARIRHGHNLTNGPGNLTKAMGIDMSYYGKSILGSQLFIDENIEKQAKQIIATPRIGIPNKGEWTDKALRFIVEGNPYVSQRKGSVATDQGWL